MKTLANRLCRATLTGAGLLLLAAGARAAPGVSVSDVRLTEGPGATAVFRVSLDTAPAAGKTTRVDFATVDVGALAGQDYTAASGTLVFRSGEPLQQSVSVALIDDAVAEPNERFQLRLSRARNASLVDRTGVATIVDNDTVTNRPPACRIDEPAGAVTTRAGGGVRFGATVSDPDGNPVSVQWTFPGGSPATSIAKDPGEVLFAAEGDFTVTLDGSDGSDGSDGKGGRCVQQSVIVHVREVPAVSINSTSVSGLVPWGFSPVPERARVLGASHTVLAVNDLGMHCVDLDGRIANILPPFQVLLAQVVRKDGVPELNPPGVSLSYSAVSNPADPILSSTGAFTGVAEDGSVYKLNF
jgi:hypothetical protein